MATTPLPKYSADAPLLTAEDLTAAYSLVCSSSLVCRTPLLTDIDPVLLGLPKDLSYRVHLKLESAQLTGSFKTRGLSVQLAGLSSGAGGDSSLRLVTMSAGNYGRSFAECCRQRGLTGLVVMPESAPQDRLETIRSLGTQVEQCPTSELQARVDAKVANEGYTFLHSFDDPALIAGHASLGLELMEQLPQVDAVFLGCGGGGLSAGVAAAFGLCGGEGRPGPVAVFAVEPETACTMRMSFEQGSPAKLPTARSVASGLAPPYAGQNTYRHLRHFGAGVLVVSDAEIRASQRRLARNLGLLVEASACAGLAALRKGGAEVRERLSGCRDVCVVLTGRNAPPSDLADLLLPSAADD